VTVSRGRVCFHAQVKLDRVEEYRERHRRVWPEMLEALQTSGWHHYSLFLRDDGLLIGYVETPSLERAQRAMAQTEVNARWQAEMADFFKIPDGEAPDEGFRVIEEIFHLEGEPAGAEQHEKR